MSGNNFAQDLWNGYVLQESAKVQARLYDTGRQQQSFNQPSVPANSQAKAASIQKTAGGGFSTKQMLIGGGLLALAVVGSMVMKRKK